MKGTSREGYDFARTGLLITKEFAHMQDEANAPSDAGHIGQVTTVMAMNTGGPASTQRAAGIRLG
jgi:hypothetical protein